MASACIWALVEWESIVFPVRRATNAGFNSLRLTTLYASRYDSQMVFTKQHEGMTKGV
jgi:hypothetical protein